MLSDDFLGTNREDNSHPIITQRTSNKQRPETIKCYECLGFVASHEGFKYELKN